MVCERGRKGSDLVKAALVSQNFCEELACGIIKLVLWFFGSGFCQKCLEGVTKVIFRVAIAFEFHDILFICGVETPFKVRGTGIKATDVSSPKACLRFILLLLGMLPGTASFLLADKAGVPLWCGSWSAFGVESSVSVIDFRVGGLLLLICGD